MDRDFTNINRYLNRLQKDVYRQPYDEGHDDWAKDAIYDLIPLVDIQTPEIRTVLDIGCGSGFCKPIFEEIGVSWTGQDYFRDESDFSFLDQYEDNSFDMVFARHALEHSPMPLLTLMEWARISKKYAMIILPAPEYWQVFGKNHYYVLPKEQWWNLFDVAGWKVVKDQDFTTSHKLFMKHYMTENAPKDRIWHGPPKVVEFRYLLEKK